MTATVLKAPCAKCPFRSDVPIYLRPGRREGIARHLTGGGRFPCHEHVDQTEDEAGEQIVLSEGPECAGARMAMMADGHMSQMARIEERLGMHDPDALEERDVPVWPLHLWPTVPEGETQATWDRDEEPEIRTCVNSDSNCIAPAGYMDGGGNGECPGCGEPLCSECAAEDGRCHMCTEVEED